MVIKEDLPAWCIYFLDKKTRLGANVNKELPQELNKPVIKNFLKKVIRGLKIMFG